MQPRWPGWWWWSTTIRYIRIANWKREDLLELLCVWRTEGQTDEGGLYRWPQNTWSDGAVDRNWRLRMINRTSSCYWSHASRTTRELDKCSNFSTPRVFKTLVGARSLWNLAAPILPQSCPWVHIIDPDPTQPNPTHGQLCTAYKAVKEFRR